MHKMDLDTLHATYAIVPIYKTLSYYFHKEHRLHADWSGSQVIAACQRQWAEQMPRTKRGWNLTTTTFSRPYSSDNYYILDTTRNYEAGFAESMMATVFAGPVAIIKLDINAQTGVWTTFINQHVPGYMDFLFRWIKQRMIAYNIVTLNVTHIKPLFGHHDLCKSLSLYDINACVDEGGTVN